MGIHNVLNHYRLNFPGENVFPKLHLLECHVLGRVRQTKRGLGLMSEQGIEGIHHQLNKSYQAFQCIPGDDRKKVEMMLRDHHIKTHPAHLSSKKIVVVGSLNHKVHGVHCMYICI